MSVKKAATVSVRPGQVWEDKDVRMEGRRVRIVRLDPERGKAVCVPALARGSQHRSILLGLGRLARGQGWKLVETSDDCPSESEAFLLSSPPAP